MTRDQGKIEKGAVMLLLGAVGGIIFFLVHKRKHCKRSEAVEQVMIDCSN